MPRESERFIKSYSSLIGSPIWPDDGLFKLYHYCLYKASRNVYLWRGIQIRPGEFPVSYRHVAAELCWSRDKLTKKFASLEEAGCVCMRKSRVGTLVRVVGWSEIQHTGGSKASPPWPENQTVSGMEIRPSWYENQATGGTENGPLWRGNQAISGTEIRPNQEEYKKSNLFPSSRPEPEGFNLLWLAYPEERRTRRAEAARLYQIAIAQGATIETIMEALNAAKQSGAWCMDNGRYIPGIVNWLQKETWRSFGKPEESTEAVKWISR